MLLSFLGHLVHMIVVAQQHTLYIHLMLHLLPLLTFLLAAITQLSPIFLNECCDSNVAR